MWLIDGNRGLKIIDISNPAAPTLVDYYDTSDFARGVQVVGNYAYVADGDGGLKIIDVSGFNSPSAIILAVSPTSVNEDGTTNLVYTFTRTGDTINPLTVNYTVGGTATFNTDYSQTGAASFPSFPSETGTVTFAAGSDTATVTIDPTADTTVEDDETVSLTLTSGTDYTVGTTTPVTGTINNDESSFNFQLILREDNNNTPGNIITDNIIKGSSFFAEIQLGDIRNNALGLIAASLNINFAADVIQNNDNPFDPTDPNSPLVTPNFPLFRNGTLDNSSGLITNLSGAAFPPIGEGSAIGVNQLSTFSLLRFQVNGTRDDSQLVINLDPNQTGYSDGSVIDPNSITQIQTTLNINDAPIVDAIATTNLSEFSPANTLVTTVNATDDNKTGQAVTFSLLTVPTDNNNNPLFTINSATGEITLTAAGSSIIDYETGPTVYTLGVKASDGYKDSPETTFTVSVSDVNENPTNLNLSNNTVAENSPLNTLIGNFTTTDPDTGNTFTYSLVTGTGSTDNSLFTIDGNQLKTNTTLDYETKNNYSIRVKTTDQGGLSYEKQLTVSITDVNESPTDVTLSNNTVAENSPLNTLIGNFNTTDPDTGNTFSYSLVTGIGSTDNSLFNRYG